MRRVFEDRVMCDLSVIVEDGFEIEVQKLILRMQCPAMLDEVVTRFVDNEAKRFIIWNTIPKDVAMAFFDFIYCEDLGKANNLAKDRLKIFMDLIEKYGMTGLKFIMEDVRFNDETQARDIDEVTTATTNSSGDELNNAEVADNHFENSTCKFNSPFTATVDKSKVVEYPLKKRSRNSDSNSGREDAKMLPSFTNITMYNDLIQRSRKFHTSNLHSIKEPLTIDCNSADSIDDIQIIGEKKKERQKIIGDVITLSDDSDKAHDSDNNSHVANSVTSKTANKSTAAARMRAGAGIGSKRIWESSESEGEEGLNRPDSACSRPFQNKEPSKLDENQVSPYYSAFYDVNDIRGDKQSTLFDPHWPSTSRAAAAAAAFDDWAAAGQVTRATDDGMHGDHQSYVSNKNLHNRREPTNMSLVSYLEKNFAIEPYDSNDTPWIDAQGAINQRLQRRKRRCSATITRSELDAMMAGGPEDTAQRSPEFSDSSNSAVKAETNVSLLNVDDDLFKNVQTPDTSATNNIPKVNADNNFGGLYLGVTENSMTLVNELPVVPAKKALIEGENKDLVPNEIVLPKADNEAPPIEQQVDEAIVDQVKEPAVTLENAALFPLFQAIDPDNDAAIDAVPVAPVAPVAPDEDAAYNVRLAGDNAVVAIPDGDVHFAPLNLEHNELVHPQQDNNDLIVEPVHSPKPNFAKMKKQELMLNLSRYGVKTNMTCIRAKKLLTHIYDFTHQEVKVVKGKKLSTRKDYDVAELQRMIADMEGYNPRRGMPEPLRNEIAEPAGNEIAELERNEIAEPAGIRVPDGGPGPGLLKNDDENQNHTRLTILEQAMIGGEYLSDTYRELLELEVRRVIINTEEFECPTCFDTVEIGGGIVLKDCAHSICRTCLSRLVESSDEAEIKCPCCTSIIQEREIKEVVAPGIYEKYLSKSLAVTANSIENAFHCKTPDCRGWCIIEDIINQPVNVFNCPVCGIANCVQCQATHPSMNCLQYQNHLAIQAEKDPIAKKTLMYLEKLKSTKKALNCPKCQIVIVKQSGCDWIQCSMCKCEICWATMGPRWGPKGHGDISGGCRCRVNQGAPCDPKCRNCH